MNIEICRSFNLDTIIETITSISYSTAANTEISDNRFSIIQNDVEPAMILRFTDSDSAPINFSATADTPNFSLSCRLGFKTTLLNQINTTTSRLTSTYDDRFDNLCNLSIDAEKLQVSGVSHNKILNQTYLTVRRSTLPKQHYRNSVIRVVRSSPSIGFIDKTLGIVKIYWARRDVAMIGVYEMELTFDRTSGGVRSKWTISPINIEVRQDYSLST